MTWRPFATMLERADTPEVAGLNGARLRSTRPVCAQRMACIIACLLWLLHPIQPIAATALHHYSFDGPGVVDSLGGADGTLVGGATIEAGSLVLDGRTGYVQFSKMLIPTNGGFTVALVARQLSPQTSYTEMISQGRSGSGFYLGHDPGRYFRIGDSWTWTGIHFPSDALAHCFVVTSESNNAAFYLDGRLLDIHSPIKAGEVGDNTRLGRQFNGWTEYFHGTIDDLWIFNGALTSGEVATLTASVTANLSLNLRPIGNRTIRQNDVLFFPAVAEGCILPSDHLRFSLDPGAPDGLHIDPETGHLLSKKWVENLPL
ncbi:MAG: LamG domain-containing protein [Verrucomicrobiota bacterium]|jgi:Concanavalin A-like lectin/glucanases superfamily